MEEGKHGETDRAERRTIWVDILLCTYESTRYRRAFPHFLREETSVMIVILNPEGSPASCGHQRKVKKTRQMSCT